MAVAWRQVGIEIKPQMSLAEENEVVEALVLDRLHKPFRVRIAVGTFRRDLGADDAPRLQDRGERFREQRVSVVNQVLRSAEKSIDGVGQVTGDLLHPLSGGIDSNAGYLDGAGLDLDDEEDHVADRAEDAENLDAEEVAGVQSLPVRLHEAGPGTFHLALRRGLNPSLGQDGGDRRSSNLHFQAGSKGVSDLRVAPAQIRSAISITSFLTS
jgi:hypothetical protein